MVRRGPGGTLVHLCLTRTLLHYVASQASFGISVNDVYA